MSETLYQFGNLTERFAELNRLAEDRNTAFAEEVMRAMNRNPKFFLITPFSTTMLKTCVLYCINANPPLETTKESNEFMKNLKSLIVSYEKYTTLLSNQKANGTWDTYANALYGNANLHDYCIHH